MRSTATLLLWLALACCAVGQIKPGSGSGSGIDPSVLLIMHGATNASFPNALRLAGGANITLSTQGTTLTVTAPSAGSSDANARYVFHGSTNGGYANSLVMKPGGNLEFVTNGTNLVMYETNLPSRVELDVDYDAAAYIASVGVTNRSSWQAVHDFVVYLKRAGLWAGLVDGWIFPSDLNRSATLRSLRGADGNLVNGPVQDRHGLVFDGVNDRADWTIPDTKVFTIIAQMDGMTTNQATTFVPICLVHQDGITTAGSAMTANGGNSVYYVYHRQGASILFSGTGWTGGYHCPAYYGNSLAPRTIHWSSPNSGSVRWGLDGQSQGTNSSAPAITSDLTKLFLGARNVTGTYDSFANVRVRAVLIFNSQLSIENVRAAEYALRLLDPLPVAVYEGDSTSYENPGKPLDSWPTIKHFGGAGTNSAHWRNMGQNGDTAASMLSYYSNQVQIFAPPRGKYAELHLHAGINDILADSAGSTVWNNYSTIARYAKRDGFRVYGSTLMWGNYTTAREAERTNFNFLVLQNAELFDGIVRRDLIYPSTNAFFLDEYHLTTDGNSNLVYEISRGVDVPRLRAGGGIAVVNIGGEFVVSTNGATLPISAGGTGATTQTSAMDALAPTTTKGDVLVDNGTNVVRLGVGSNGQVLTANSAAATGVEWAAGGGGGGSGTLTTRGDLLTRDASAEVRLPVSPMVAWLISDGVDPKWINAQNGYFDFDEFLTQVGSAYGETPWTASTTPVTETSNPTNHGVISITTGTATNGVNRLTKNLSSTTFGAGVYYWLAYVHFQTLSDATDRYVGRIGMGDSTAAAAFTDGVWFEYSDDVNGGSWQCKTAAGGTVSTLNTAIAPVAGVYQRLAFKVNAAGDSVEFFINGTSVGSAGSSTTVPNSSTELCGWEMIINKAAGTTARKWMIDRTDYAYILTNPRP